jgi:hypothetical protein
LSLWVPPATIPALNDGDPLIAKVLKDLVASLQAHLNGNVGNPNINTALDPGEDIDYDKLNLTGKIQAGDIASGGFSLASIGTLKAKAQASPNNTVAVQAGTYLSLSGLATRVYAGGNSGAFANTSGAGQNRIDVLMIDDAGALSITAGAEGGAPVAPNYPTTKVPIAEVYIRFSGTGVVIKDADDTINSYIKTDARNLIQFTGVPDDSITTPKLVAGAAMGFLEASGSTDIADPGTSFVTMTDMVFAGQAVAGFALGDRVLLEFYGIIELNQADSDTNFPMAELRIMAGNAGAAVEVARTVVDLRKLLPHVGGTPNIQPGPIAVPVSFGVRWGIGAGPTYDMRVEWRRTNGAVAGTPTIRQPAATYTAARKFEVLWFKRPAF